VLGFLKFAVLASLLLLPACTRNEPGKMAQDAKQSVKDKATDGSSRSQTDSLKGIQDLDGAWRLEEVEFGPNVAGEEALNSTARLQMTHLCGCFLWDFVACAFRLWW
jgi:hypothetical protein